MRETLATGLDVVALAVMLAFTISVGMALTWSGSWAEIAIFGVLSVGGVYLVGRAARNLWTRLARSA